MLLFYIVDVWQNTLKFQIAVNVRAIWIASDRWLFVAENQRNQTQLGEPRRSWIIRFYPWRRQGHLASALGPGRSKRRRPDGLEFELYAQSDPEATKLYAIILNTLM